MVLGDWQTVGYSHTDWRPDELNLSRVIANTVKRNRAATTLTRGGSAAAHATSGGRFGLSESAKCV
jgi:hypothetical protein